MIRDFFRAAVIVLVALTLGAMADEWAQRQAELERAAQIVESVQ